MELVDNPYISDFTKKTLEQFGWEKDDPIPADLGELLVQFKEALPASKKTDVLVDAELMAEDDIEKVKAMLAEAKVVAADKLKTANKNKKLASMNPAVAAAYQKVAQQLEVVDDREEAATIEEPEPAAEPNEPKTESVPTTPPPEEQRRDVPGLRDAVPFCPRCGWDVRQKYETDPTDRDKEDFLATLLGSARFKKEYELFGGKIKVLFRGLLAEENKLIYRQLVLDQQENRISTEAEWFLQMMDYRLACSLERISDGSGKVLSIVPELLERKADTTTEPLATPLPAQLEYLNKDVLAQEVTRRLVGTHLRQFQRLIEALEAMALEPSFWNGIE